MRNQFCWCHAAASQVTFRQCLLVHWLPVSRTAQIVVETRIGALKSEAAGAPALADRDGPSPVVGEGRGPAGLGLSGEPTLDAAPSGENRRCRVQARQAFAFAAGTGLGWTGDRALAIRIGLDALNQHYRRADGLYRTLVNRRAFPSTIPPSSMTRPSSCCAGDGPALPAGERG